ncbi:hypothetical protein SCA6_001014 [Theobroma cacao]|uniref:Gb:AAF32477.1, putative n=1 Tax=Theobroma cacao TaxID=3641 RepID=A0A061FSL8_THECC|nr:Gb:AAF32477.1, putative [Theobroma cacao]
MKGIERLFTHRIDSSRLKTGDHIYAYRFIRLYSHHGIFVGDSRVIHFIQTKSNKGASKDKPPCETCGYQKNVHLGVIKTCLDCFLSRRLFSSKSLHLYQYEEHKFEKLVKMPGTGSTAACFPPETVVEIAEAFHVNNNFGGYDLFGNNCEGFATSCKTGHPISEQITSIKNTPIIGVIAPILTNALDHLKSSS